MRDTVGLSALDLGSDPANLTQEQFDASLAEIDTAVKAGWVRQVKGNSYTEDLAGGGAVLAMGWSGRHLTLSVPDQTKTQDFQWALAERGRDALDGQHGHPEGLAEQGSWREHWIDFYYDPKNAAAIEAYVNYVCPVVGARDVMLTIDPELANNPLIFPPEDWLARLHQFRATTAEEESRLDRGLHQGHGPLGTDDASRDQLRVDRPVRPAGAGPALARRLLHLPGDPDVPGLAVDRQRPGRVPADVELGDLPGGVPGVLAVDRPLDRVRRPRHDPRLRARLPARLRDRLPRRAPTRTCCCSSSSPRSSRASCCGPSPGRSSSSDDGLVLGPLKDDRDHPGRLPAAGHAGRRHRRHHLQLPAVHDPAAVRRAREDRPAAARGGRGPLRRSVAAARDDRRGHRSAALLGVVVGVVMDYGPIVAGRSRALIAGASIGTLLISEAFIRVDPAARAAGHLRRLAARVHPGGRRLRQRRAARATRSR